MKYCNLSVWLLVCSLLFSGQALSRSAEPLVNLENQAIAAGSGKALDLADVFRALRQAAPKRGWVVQEVVPGKALATLNVRGKHTIVVEVTYTEKTISLVYKDSINMKYGLNEEGRPEIHPFYMKWLNNFMSDLRVELARF